MLNPGTIRTEVILSEREWLTVYNAAKPLGLSVAEFQRLAINTQLEAQGIAERIEVTRPKGRPRKQEAHGAKA